MGIGSTKFYKLYKSLLFGLFSSVFSHPKYSPTYLLKTFTIIIVQESLENPTNPPVIGIPFSPCHNVIFQIIDSHIIPKKEIPVSIVFQMRRWYFHCEIKC